MVELIPLNNFYFWLKLERTVTSSMSLGLECKVSRTQQLPNTDHLRINLVSNVNKECLL